MTVYSFGDIIINNWKQAKLLKPSVIKPIFTTVEIKLILKKLGSLKNEDRLSEVLQPAPNHRPEKKKDS